MSISALFGWSSHIWCWSLYLYPGQINPMRPLLIMGKSQFTKNPMIWFIGYWLHQLKYSKDCDWFVVTLYKSLLHLIYHLYIILKWKKVNSKMIKHDFIKYPHSWFWYSLPWQSPIAKRVLGLGVDNFPTDPCFVALLTRTDDSQRHKATIQFKVQLRVQHWQMKRTWE